MYTMHDTVSKPIRLQLTARVYWQWLCQLLLLYYRNCGH